MSHILPEFGYCCIYDDKHRIIEIRSRGSRAIKLRQSGLKERMLCQSCENLLSKYECYAQKVIFGGDIKASWEDNSNGSFTATVDYSRMKIFQLSLLWRLGASSQPFFGHVQLGPHENRLRNMILNEAPGEYYEYGCVLMAILTKDGLFDSIRSPEQLRIENYRCYRLTYGGFIWLYVVSNHSRKFPLSDFFLKEDGTQVIVLEKAENLNFLKADARQFAPAKSSLLRLQSKLKK